MSQNVRDMKRAASFQTRYRISVWDNGEGQGYGCWVEVDAEFWSCSRSEMALREWLHDNGDDMPPGLYQAKAGSYHAELRFTGGGGVA